MKRLGIILLTLCLLQFSLTPSYAFVGSEELWVSKHLGSMAARDAATGNWLLSVKWWLKQDAGKNIQYWTTAILSNQAVAVLGRIAFGAGMLLNVVELVSFMQSQGWSLTDGVWMKPGTNSYLDGAMPWTDHTDAGVRYVVFGPFPAMGLVYNEPAWQATCGVYG